MNVQIESSLFEIYASYQSQASGIFVALFPTEAEALYAYEALSCFQDESLYFLPGFHQAGVMKFESVRFATAQRNNILYQIKHSSKSFLFCSLLGLGRKVHSQISSLEIKKGDSFSLNLLVEKLQEWDYEKTQEVKHIGEWSTRGQILDLWPPSSSFPVRLEFFGDEIDRLCFFRPEEGRSFEQISSCVLLPIHEFFWPQKDYPSSMGLDSLHQYLLRHQISQGNRSAIMECLRNQLTFPGIEDSSSLFYTYDSSSLLSFLKKYHFETNVLALGSGTDFDREISHLQKVYDQSFQSALAKGQFAVPFEVVFPKLLEEYQGIKSFLSHYQSFPLFHFPTVMQKNLKEKIEYLQENVFPKEMKHLIFTARSQDAFWDIIPFLPSSWTSSLPASWPSLTWEHFASPSSPFTFATSLLQSSFYHPQSKTLLLSLPSLKGMEIQSTQTQLQKPQILVSSSKAALIRLNEIQFGEFQEGDKVVHVQYGVGKYLGISTVEIQGITTDFLSIEYANKDKIHVPVSRMNLVQKYVGRPDREVDSIKSQIQWERKRQKAKDDAFKIAQELMNHEAKRKSTIGFAYGKPDEYYLEFESLFPYEETPDQLQAIQDILEDMRKPRPMDRLLVGDVGFGKTEVAMRAAYFAILHQKQVAWLVPTSVLAHQHFRSLKERMGHLGVRVLLADRTMGAKSLQGVKDKSIDMVIGTHRLLSKDVQFADLGLVVVDEEQRFGVTQKEKLKQFFYGVDALTMTATPIPRTLQMAVVGLRDLSLLGTPPKARLSVKTFVCPFHEDIVKEALETELARSGQIFYVHNKIQDLPGIQEFLQNISPKARIIIGHGSMSQNELDKIMIDFIDQKYDILISTTIIESGIDMPNVNTILIQNADHFGLSQLYQLRGRVGRRSTRGYAYLFHSSTLKPQDDGAKRLEILQQHQELGSGFSIATYDLEMRGAGSLVGDDQSGFSQEVGLEAYSHMLEEALESLGKLDVSTRQTEPEINLPVSTLIPDIYIPRNKERLKMYRKIFASPTEESLLDLLDICKDKYGPLPQEVIFCAEYSRLRRMLMNMGGLSLNVQSDFTELRFLNDVVQGKSEISEKLSKKILEMCNLRGARMMLQGNLLLPIKTMFFKQDPVKAFQELKKLLSFLQP